MVMNRQYTSSKLMCSTLISRNADNCSEKRLPTISHKPVEIALKVRIERAYCLNLSSYSYLALIRLDSMCRPTRVMAIFIQERKLLNSPYSPFVSSLAKIGVVIKPIHLTRKLDKVYHTPDFRALILLFGFTF